MTDFDTTWGARCPHGFARRGNCSTCKGEAAKAQQRATARKFSVGRRSAYERPAEPSASEKARIRLKWYVNGEAVYEAYDGSTWNLLGEHQLNGRQRLALGLD